MQVNKLKKIFKKSTFRSFFLKRNHKSKIFNKHFVARLIVIAFFLGINIALGSFFLKNNKVHLPTKLSKYLLDLGVMKNANVVFLNNELSTDDSGSLDPQIILEKLNKERIIFEVGELEYDNSLASVAAILLNEAEKIDFDLTQTDFLPQLKDALSQVDYKYAHVSHNILVGPSLEQAVVNSWFSDESQVKALKDDDFIHVGFATKFIDLQDVGRVGVVVQVLGKPLIQINTLAKTRVSKAPVLPVVTDQEVINALNDYRKVHLVRTLNIDDNLCTYAEKRVQDLVAFGKLDEHAGFKNDFADPENLPESIKNYSGTQIAENLAHQYCKNMTTGDSFIAETGTAIIEWCFDSSTLGHREAQLNNDFENVCVRHGNGMYVVIFGD